MRHSVRSLLVRAFAGIAILGLVGYTIYRLLPLMRGPRIVIEEPRSGTAASSSVDIVGQAYRTQTLSLNGRELTLEQKGRFSDTLALPVGYTIIELEATDRFNKHTSRTLHIYRADNGNATLPVSPDIGETGEETTTATTTTSTPAVTH